MVPEKTTTKHLTTAPVETNLLCNFDNYNVANPNICGGIEFSANIGASQLSGLQIDNLPSIRSISITDFTSISKTTL
jgi:hypothetical protein